eukprot:COSAG05_NODE_884_length_6764_cov_4.360840_2_plen_80_part_00
MPSIIYCAGDESISHFCANLDLHLVREKRTDEAFWANLAGAEWCMHLAAGSYYLSYCIILYRTATSSLAHRVSVPVLND